MTAQARPVTDEEVDTVLTALSARIAADWVRLDGPGRLERGEPWTVDVMTVRREVCEQVAAALGRPEDASHLLDVVQRAIRGEVSSEAGQVRCRTVGCEGHLRAVRGHTGTACASCGEPRTRALWLV